ncbi:fimbria/pilus outer membrane usher protein [Salmonella enterica]|nr:fimbria/pilus outer membrane usher protein [Salmonella enterica]
MKITRLAILITLTFSVLKSQATEFNASLLDSGNLSNVDLTAFSREGYVAPGNYILDIWLNDQPVREQYPVRVVPVAGRDAAVICVTTDMVAMLGLKDKIIHGLKPVTGIPDGQCLELRSADSQVRYSAENQRLTFIIPQAWMRYQDPDWVPPSRWSDGVTAGLLDYNLMVNRYMPQQGETSTSYSLYGTAGFNLGAWRLRSDYQYSRFDSGQGASQSDFYLPQTYLFRALPALRSKLTLGQTYLSSAIFDSFRFAGLTLASDERMLPPSLQGYAPKISGIANSNAQVTVSQNGRILYQTRVSPGPFELPDLSQNISGNLDVSVRESDGNRGGLQQTVNYSDFHNPDTTWNISAGHNRYDTGSNSSFSGSVQSRLPWGQAAADATLQPGQYRSLGLSWYGSVTATAHGAAFSQSMAGNEPRMMIDTGDVAGVPVNGNSGVTNRFGVGVVSAGSSYRRSDISVDVAALPEDVDVSSSVISQVLTEGAVGYRKIDASQGEQVLGHIRLADGASPPFGALVVSGKSGRTAGMVGDDGLAYLTGLSGEDRRILNVSWDGRVQCRLTLPETVTLSRGPLLLPCR